VRKKICKGGLSGVWEGLVRKRELLEFLVPPEGLLSP
jgi:hypothetical protein